MKKFLSGLLACAMLALTAGAMAEDLYTPGTYTGVGTGCHGEMTVEVTVSNPIASSKSFRLYLSSRSSLTSAAFSP